MTDKLTQLVFPIYIGWIYGNSDDRTILEKLGVKGEMIWSSRTTKGIFAHCECTKGILGRLEKSYPAFWRGSFTKTDERAYREYRHQFEE